MEKEEEKPGTQKTDPVAEYLKAKGLFDERHKVTDGLGAAQELFHSKNKITAQVRDIADRDRRIKELEANLNTKREKEEIEEEIPDAGLRRVAQETRATQKTLQDIEQELFILRHEDYNEREETMQEILREKPEIMEISSPRKRAQMLYDLAGKRLEQEGDKAKAASRAGVPRAAFREPVSPTGSEPPGTGPEGATFREEMDKMVKELKKELAAAKGDPGKKDEITDKFNRREMKIREKYGELE